MSRAALGRCTCREDGEECARCLRLIAERDQDRDDVLSADDWDRLEAGQLWNEVPS